jgi:hypothetical protein
MRRFICLIAIAAICSSFASCEAADDPDKDVAELVSIIAEMPCWPLLPLLADANVEVESREQARAVEQAAHRIRQYDLNSIRKAFVECHRLDRKARSDTYSNLKLYILNRYLFQTPDSIERRSKHFLHLLAGSPGAIPITGVYGEPAPDDRMDTLWPWYKDDEGRMRFGVHRTMLLRLGPPYDAVKTFDYLREKFGRRKFESKDRQPTK